ncbi:MAG: fructosamine kinase family protein [Melioribacteraceae bacterium]|nr:fructosamine kinase family protein [Melioribacteraceae bacterium]
MDNIHKKLEEELHQKVTSYTSLGGGCIGNALKVITENGNKYFVKSYENSKMHKAEANGLNELKTANAIRIPRVLKFNDDFLFLEFIESAPPVNDFSQKFGRQFAQLHKTVGRSYGYFEDNYIGSTEQINLPQNDNWAEFFFENRLMFQFRLAEKNGYSDAKLHEGIKNIEKNINKILEGSEEKPTLLHGDLWGGNYIPDQRGNPCLIDPAVYFGHREADLAMTKLFGGFDREFYRSYQEEYPLKEGWEYRQNLYKLYHVLNHLNLFGTTYLSQAIYIVNNYK